MRKKSQVSTGTDAREVVRTIAHGAAAGAVGGCFLPLLSPEVARLIAAQADEVLAYGLIWFMCVQIGVTAAILFAVLDQDCGRNQS